MRVKTMRTANAGHRVLMTAVLAFFALICWLNVWTADIELVPLRDELKRTIVELGDEGETKGAP